MHLQNAHTDTHTHRHHRVHAQRHHEHIHRWTPIQASHTWSDARLVSRYRDTNMDMHVNHGMYEIWNHPSIYLLRDGVHNVSLCVAVCSSVLLCVTVCFCVLLCVAVSANMDVGMDERTLRVNNSHLWRYKPEILEAVQRVNLCPKLVENALSDALLMSSFRKIAAGAAFKLRAVFCVTLLKSAHWFPDSCQKPSLRPLSHFWGGSFIWRTPFVPKPI